jgi:hypothetical protein
MSYGSRWNPSSSNFNPASSSPDSAEVEAAEQAQFLEHLKKFGFDPSTLPQPAEPKQKENTQNLPRPNPQNNATTVNQQQQQQMMAQNGMQWYTYQQQQQQ